jgi:two-component system cell cycle response regulator
MRVLIVDDSRVFRRALQTELMGGGYEVEAAEDGLQALACLRAQGFDLVTLDVDMPDLDGFATCERIRNEEFRGRTGRDIRVLFVTSRDTLADRQRGFELGATDFFHKRNFKPGELLAAVNAMLRPQRRLEGLQAMVVDDSSVARSLAAGHLREQGVAVVEADSGEAALTALAKVQDIDMILTDFHMPGMSGPDLCRHLRREFGWKEVPIIFLTSSDSQQEVVDLFAAGATDFLHKPFSKDELIARLSVHLQARQLNKKLAVFNAQLEQRVKEATHEIRAKNILLEQGLREVTALNRVSLALNATASVVEVLERVGTHGREVLNAEACTVYVLDRARAELIMGGGGEAVRVPLEEAALVEAAPIGEGVRVTVGDTVSHWRQVASDTVRSRVSVPLAVGESLVGVLQAVNKKSIDPFDTHDEQLLQTFAAMASVALQSARLLEETRRLADELRDSLEKERWLAIEKEKMGAYVPKHVVDEISRNREQKLALGGKLVRASILFSDIQGFTRLSEDLPPQRLVSFLNEYMTALTRIIEEERGIVDKFIGDAIMAIFLPADAQDNYALRAVRAGVRMQQQLALLRTEWATRRPEVTELRTRVGINTGEVVAGNIGSETRMDYTVIGDNVNVASRIESNGVGGQVHISESTWIDIEGQMPAQRLEPIHVKNREKPVQIYAVEVPDVVSVPQPTS